MGNLVRDWTDILPIDSIPPEDNVIIRGDGNVSIGINLKMPEIYSMTNEDYNKMHESFVTAMKVLPNGTSLHKQDFFYVDNHLCDFGEEDKIIHRHNLMKYHKRPILRHYSRIYLTFNTQRGIKRYKYAGIKPFHWATGEKKLGDIPGIGRLLESATDTFLNNLNGIPGFKAVRMTSSELLCAFYDYMSLNYDSPSNDAEKVKELNLPELLVVDGKILIGNQFVNVISLKMEGDRLMVADQAKTAKAEVFETGIHSGSDIKMPTSFVFPIALGFPVNHILNTVIEIHDNEKIIDHVNSVKSKLNLGKAIQHEAAISKQNNITAYKSALVEENFQGCITSVNMIINHPDPVKLERFAKMASVAFDSMKNARSWQEVEGTYYNFTNSAPGCANNLNQKIISTINQSACYLNLESLYLSDPHGVVFIDRFGSPVVLNMWDSPYIVNRNKILLGPSGSGKSFFMNFYVTQLLNMGNHVVLIDIGHSYKRNGVFENARYFDSSDLNNFRLNIFLCPRDSQGKFLYRGEEGDSSDIINKIKTILTVIWRGKQGKLADNEIPIIEDLIKNFYEFVNQNNVFPNVDEFYKYIELYEEKMPEEFKKGNYIDLNSLRMSLKRYTSEGESGKLFNAKEEIDILQDKFIIFDLEAVSKGDERLFAVLCVVIIDLIIQMISQLKGVNKSLIIDEALDFLTDEKMGDFIAYLYRTIRKKDGEVIIATQDATYIKALPEIVRGSILRNSDTKILLDHSNSPDSFIDLVQLGIVQPKHLPMVKSLKKYKNSRELVIIQGQKAGVYLVEVSEFAGAVYTSVQADVVEIEKYFEETHYMPAAIDMYLERKKQLTN